MRTNRLFTAAAAALAAAAVLAGPGAASAATGVRPWVIVLCNFADTPLDPTTGARREPRTPQYFENLFTQAGAGQGGLYDYFRDESYGSLSLMGSTVAGWYTLADTRADALRKSRYDRWLDCVRQAEKDVDFEHYIGAVAAFEGPYDTYGLTPVSATIDGITKQWGGAALDEFGWEPTIAAQEMAHGFGLKEHSWSANPDSEYGDQWDVMSAWTSNLPINGAFGRAGPGFNAHHRKLLGWMPLGRRYFWSSSCASPRCPGYVTLAALESQQWRGHLMAELAIGGKVYTVEFRARTGWDAGIPKDVLLVHEIRSGRSFLLPTWGGSFGAGQTWRSADRRVRVHVTSIQGAAGLAEVTIEDTTVDFSPEHLVFRDQKRGTTSPSQNIIVSNNSAAPLTIGPVTASANFAASGCGSVLGPGTTCAVSVSYTPGPAGPHGGVVSIPHSLSPMIPLLTTLEGWTAQPKVSLSPASFSLSSRVGSLAGGAVTVQNIGADTLTILNAWIDDRGGDPAQWNAWDFRVDTSGSTCLTNPQVQVWGACTINVNFLSNIDGTFDAKLYLETDAPGSIDKVLLSGTAATPSLSLTPASLDFGYLPFGASKTMQVTLTNVSAVPVAMNGVQAGGSYSVGANPCPAQLQPGASCTVSVIFSPTGNALLRGTLAVLTDAPASPHLVELIGFGDPILSASPTNIDFGSIAVGSQSAARVVTLSNDLVSGDQLIVTRVSPAGPNASEFLLLRPQDPADCRTHTVLQAGSTTCTVPVVFSPQATGFREAALVIETNAGSIGTVHVPLEGEGV